jgi:hypothetical protein
MVCRVWRVARSTVYAPRLVESGLNDVARIRPQSDDRVGGRDDGTPRPPAKRGPRTPLADGQLLDAIRTVLRASPFCTEGHRKVLARLRACIGLAQSDKTRG